MPLYSDLSSMSMYYSGSPSATTYNPYTTATATPIGVSYSSSYLGSGGSYSAHSSLGGYGRAPPLSSRYVSSGRTYSPMLTTISERGTSSPVRVNSPRRLPISSKYSSAAYVPRPVNINTADIDVSRERYRSRPTTASSYAPAPTNEITKYSYTPVKDTPKYTSSTKQKEVKSSQDEVVKSPQDTQEDPSPVEPDEGPFMPRIDGKTGSGDDNSPGLQRSTIRRGRTVVRLHTLKRKERDSPRKTQDELNNVDSNMTPSESTPVEDTQAGSNKSSPKGSNWREKLSEDLIYKEKRERKTPGEKLVEKFIVKDKNEDEGNISRKNSPPNNEISQLKDNINLQTLHAVVNNHYSNKSPERRCSMELLAEQANVLDSLIRNENLSTACLDISKIGTKDSSPPKIQTIFRSSKKRKSGKSSDTRLQTTQSDHAIHERVKTLGLINKDNRSFSRKSSLKKSASGGSICRLDSIVELSKEPLVMELPTIKENKGPVKVEKLPVKPKQKTKITSTVEISQSQNPLKVRVGKVIVEQKINEPRKEINFTSSVEENKANVQDNPGLGASKRKIFDKSTDPASFAKDHLIKKTKSVRIPSPPCESDEAGTEDCNFWDKIGKRETIYLKNRQQKIQEAIEKNRRALYWFQEDEEEDIPVLSLAPTNEDERTHTETSSMNRDVDDASVSTEFHSENVIECADENSTRNRHTYNLDESKLKNVQNQDIDKSSDNSSKISNDSIRDSTISTKHLTASQSYNLGDISLTNDCKPLSASQTQMSDKVKNDKWANNATDKINVKEENSLKIKTHQKEILEPMFVVNEINSNINEPKINIQDNIDKKIITETKDEIIKIDDELKTSTNICKNGSPKSKGSSESANKDSDKSISIEFKEITHEIEKDIKTPRVPKKISPKSNGNTKTSIQKAEDIFVESKPNDLFKNISPKSQQILKNTNDNIIKTTEIKSIKTETPKTLTQLKSDEVSKQDADVNNLRESKKKSEDIVVESQESESVKKMSSKNKNKSKTTNSNEQQATAHIGKHTEEKYLTGKKNEQVAPQGTANDLLSSGSNIKEDNNSSSEIGNTVEVMSEITRENKESPEKALSPEFIFASSQTKDIPNSEMAIPKEAVANSDITTILSDNITAPPSMEKDLEQSSSTNVIKLPAPVKRKPIKEEAMVRPLYATPRPLQKKVPQIIHSSSSSESSSEESDDEEEESADSEVSTEFYECENAGQDGRTSTGSNDSGFDSSAPTSPAGFVCVKKDCDVNCHRKCEKLTANLCGVNQRLLVEALATRASIRRGGENAGASTSGSQANSVSESGETMLESSTAYGVFRRTGRVTPPAKSIPRFRKYTIEDFHFLKVLGKGSFGKVLLAELRDTEYYYAVKCLKKDVVLEDDDVECTLIERKVLALGTNHPYLCHLFATFQTDSHLFFVMEYLNGGDLMFHIQQSGRFPEPRAKFYAAEIVSGLKFLHKRGIIYRDLKLDNILLDYEGHVRIADFGMCKLQIYLEKTADTFCGTPDYMAPEIIKGLKYNQTVDWWSFGVLLYEMLIGQSPFSGCDEDELFWSICNELPSYPRFLSQEAHTILVRLLDKDARTRLGGTDCIHGDVREQDFFHSIQWDRLDRRELESPFRPRVRHPYDTQYFDRAFTGERPRLTEVELNVLRTMDQQPFRGFSYTNPNATDR